jgi:HAD superfamily, subfamily IIIB (Acid phosphatase)
MILLDLDGTLFDNSHRKHLVECETPDWKAFLSPELAAKDPVFPEAKMALDLLKKHTSHNFVFLTGRNESLREVTGKAIVEKLEIPLDNLNHLIMRPVDNYDKPSVFKSKEINKILNWVLPKEVIAIDDDPYLVPVYLAHGVFPLLAPDCWKYICQLNELPTETYWRR